MFGVFIVLMFWLNPGVNLKFYFNFVILSLNLDHFDNKAWF